MDTRKKCKQWLGYVEKVTWTYGPCGLGGPACCVNCVWEESMAWMFAEWELLKSHEWLNPFTLGCGDTLTHSVRHSAFKKRKNWVSINTPWREEMIAFLNTLQMPFSVLRVKFHHLPDSWENCGTSMIIVFLFSLMVVVGNMKKLKIREVRNLP